MPPVMLGAALLQFVRGHVCVSMGSRQHARQRRVLLPLLVLAACCCCLCSPELRGERRHGPWRRSREAATWSMGRRARGQQRALPQVRVLVSAERLHGHDSWLWAGGCGAHQGREGQSGAWPGLPGAGAAAAVSWHPCQREGAHSQSIGRGYSSHFTWDTPHQGQKIKVQSKERQKINDDIKSGKLSKCKVSGG
nr:uncharacterized protein LOC109756670 [Aegilops tauschii subsp. strangulata]